MCIKIYSPKKKFSAHAALFILPILFLSACTSPVDISLKEGDSLLFVDARFSTDTMAHSVILKRSNPYYNPKVDSLFVSGASVYIEEIDGPRFYLTEEDSLPGTYRTPSHVCGKMGRRYRLHISNIDINLDGRGEEYEAVSDMPYITEKLDSVVGVYGPSRPPFFHSNPDVLGWSLLLYAQDPPTKEYYAFTISINGIPYDNRITKMKRMPDDFTQGLYIKGIALYFFADKKKPKLQKGDSILFEARSITQIYNQYIEDVRSVLTPSNPMFGGSPSNVRGNISNGAVGCFSVYATRRTLSVLK